VTSRALTVLAFLAIAGMLVLVELYARREDSRVPTFPSLLRRAMRTRSAQLGILLAWWWLGWHFVLGL
jgi:hypothetical protein